MLVQKINNINFNGKIIDAHGHVGNWYYKSKLYDTTPDMDTIVKSELKNGDTIEKVIISNLDCMVDKYKYNDEIKHIEFLKNEYQGNKELLEFCNKNEKYAPLAVCQPEYGSVEEIKRLFKDYPNRFVGLKFHPEELNVTAQSYTYEAYLEFAEKENLPCLFHCSNTWDVSYPDGGVGRHSYCSRPEQIYENAKKYKNVPVILAHYGGDGEANYNKVTECILQSIEKKDANLFADISWVDCDRPEKPNLKRIIAQLKEKNALDRLLFGTDAPIARFGSKSGLATPPVEVYTNTIEDIKKMIRKEFPSDAEEIIDKIFYKNAEELFFKPKSNPSGGNSSTGNVTTKSKSKLGYVIAGVAIIASSIGLYLYSKKQKSNEAIKSMENQSKQIDIKA